MGQGTGGQERKQWEQEDRRGNSGNKRTWSRRRKDQVYDEMEDREQKDGE